MALTACSVFQVEKTESDGTAMPTNIPNPAAVDCEIGKQLVITTNADGSQSSECVTPDGSGGNIPPETTEEIADWWGVIKSTDAGAQYDDYFERQDITGQVIYLASIQWTRLSRNRSLLCATVVRSFTCMAPCSAM
jgi:putative hemolysin